MVILFKVLVQRFSDFRMGGYVSENSKHLEIIIKIYINIFGHFLHRMGKLHCHNVPMKFACKTYSWAPVNPCYELVKALQQYMVLSCGSAKLIKCWGTEETKKHRNKET